MAKETGEIRVPEGAGGERTDMFLSVNYPGFSRTFFKSLIKEGMVTVNGSAVKPSKIVNDSDVIKVKFPETPRFKFEKIPFEIIYEDRHILVINKPAGISVHPAGRPSELRPTVLDVLMDRIPEIHRMSKDKKLIRPGIVHRLDKNTSGVMIIAKTPEAARNLSSQFAKRTVEKIYVAIVCGTFSEQSGIINSQIGRDLKDRRKFSTSTGKESVTAFKVIKRFAAFTLLEIKPLTGRTHQIRIHLSMIGHPVLGDNVYSNSKGGEAVLRQQGVACQPEPGIGRQMLHAKKIVINHPKNSRRLSFTAKIPADFASALRKIAALLLCAIFFGYSFAQTEISTVTSVSPAPSEKESGNVKKSEETSAVPEKKTKTTPAGAELKKLSGDIGKIQSELEKIKSSIEHASLNYENSDKRMKESNLAVADLNRKITEIEASLEKFRSEVKMGAIEERDKKSSAGALEGEQQRLDTFEKGVSEKVSNLESELSLVKTALSQLQEKVGVSNSNALLEPAQEQPEPATLSKIKKIGSSPWATVTAVFISVVALIIAVSK